MQKLLTKVFVIKLWNDKGESTPMWATDTYEKAVSDIENYCSDLYTYTIEEIAVYTAPNLYFTEE